MSCFIIEDMETSYTQITLLILSWGKLFLKIWGQNERLKIKRQIFSIFLTLFTQKFMDFPLIIFYFFPNSAIKSP